MKSVNYCLPIIQSSQRRVESLIRKQRAKYRFFEVWLDYVQDADREFLDRTARSAGKQKLVYLFRRLSLERIQMPMDQRAELLQHMPAAALLDLDMLTQRREIDLVLAAKKRPTLILSYHNYRSTPRQQELRKLVECMLDSGADICKIAAYCGTPRDALRLLELLLELREQNLKCIVLGMGAHGRITRIFGSLWGNYMTYAPLKLAQRSAPGQLSRADLDDIFGALID